MSYRDIIREAYALFKGTRVQFAKKAHIRDTYVSAITNESPKASGSESTAATAVRAALDKALEDYLRERTEAATEEERWIIGKLLFILRHDPPRAGWITGNVTTFYEQSLIEVRKESEKSSKAEGGKEADDKGRSPPPLEKTVGKKRRP